MSVYTAWKSGKTGAHQIMALLSSYHIGQITQPEAVAIMDSWGFTNAEKQQMQTLYNALVGGTIDRAALDNAFMLGDVDAPGFSTEQEVLAKLGL